MGIGFDCASGPELKNIAKLFENMPGGFADSTIFANPCKTFQDLHVASSLFSGPTVVDSVQEVEKLSQYGWSRGSLIRIAVADSGSKMPFSKKFGASLAEIPKINNAAKTLSQKIHGVSFHVGSGCEKPSQYSEAIQSALRVLHGLPGTNIIDIGGGFESESFSHAAKHVQKSINSIPKHLKIQWIAEPGRFMAADFQDLFVPVIGKKPSGNGVAWRYTINESIYGEFSCIPFDRAVPTFLRVRMKNELPRKRSSGVLFGRTCDSVDMIAQSDNMEELEVGDWLWFPHMGAYTKVSASSFNGLLKPKIHYLDNDKDQLPYLKSMDSENWPQHLKTVTYIFDPHYHHQAFSTFPHRW